MAQLNWETTNYFCEVVEKLGVKLPDNLQYISMDLIGMPEHIPTITFHCLADSDVIEKILDALKTSAVKEKLDKAK